MIRALFTLADNFAEQWLGLRGLTRCPAGSTGVSGIQLGAGSCIPDRDAAVHPQSHSGKPEHPRSAGRRLHLSQRDAGEALRNAGVIGPGFRRVTLPAGSNRGGLLTQGSILMLTSHPTATSPVLRGKWILSNLLNSPPPPPPANVPPLDESPADGRKLTTRREGGTAPEQCRLRVLPCAHRSAGIRARELRWNRPVASSTTRAAKSILRECCPSGETFSGPQGLKNLLLEHSDDFARSAVERLMTYALGRELDARDQPAVRDIMRSTEANRYRFSDLIAAVVKSVPFQMRQTKEQ